MTDSSPHPTLSADTAGSLRSAHLQMIQGVIARMSGYSASVKNFAITIVVGLLAYYSQRPDDRMFLFAVGSVVALALLDIHYLRCEKAFRSLYDAVRQQPITAPTDFRIDARFKSEHSLIRVASTWSITHFYLPVLAAVAVLYLVLKVWPL
jgi:hypothetical protein